MPLTSCVTLKKILTFLGLTASPGEPMRGVDGLKNLSGKWLLPYSTAVEKVELLYFFSLMVTHLPPLAS